MNKYGWCAAGLSLAIGAVEAAPMDSTDVLRDQLVGLDNQVRAVADTGVIPPLKLLQERHDVVERLSTFGLQAVDALRLSATERARLVAAQPAARALIEDVVTVTGQSQPFVADDFGAGRYPSKASWRASAPGS